MHLTAWRQNKKGAGLLRPKTWMFMKLTTAFVLVFAFQGFANGYSQKINLVRKHAPLLDIFKAIEQQSGYLFFYDKAIIEKTEPIDISLQNATIEQALSTCLKGQDLIYKIVNNTIVIRHKKGLNREIVQVAVVSSLPPPVKIGGRVQNQKGEPLENVSVTVVGSGKGTTTDGEGRFLLELSDSENAELEISIIGFKTQKVLLGNRTEINIRLEESASDLSDVVVVGFGTQKKVDLTGAVSTLSGKQIPNVPITQASQLFSGLVSGVNFKQGSSQPGKDDAGITIHGLGTFSGAGTDPLIIIDGVSSSFDDVNPNDIESVSVLKDAASASIYGARAANGVILIQTKKGKSGKLKISYNGYAGKQSPSETPKFADSWVYAEMINEALTNNGQSKQYTDDEIAKFKSGTDPLYPNKRHYDDLIKSGNGLQSNHYLSLSGGNSSNQYMLSFGYLDQNGLIDRTYFKRYNLRFNFDSKLSDKLSLHAQFSGKNAIQNEPSTPGNEPVTGAEGLIDYAIKIPNTTPGRLPDGTYGNFTGFTTEGWMDSRSFDKIVSNTFIGNVRLDWEIIKSLKLSGVAGYNYGVSSEDVFRSLLVIDPNLTEGPANLTSSKGTSSLLTLQALLNYDFSFHGNSFHFLGGYSEEGSRVESLQGYRDNFPNNSLYELNVGSQTNMQSFGTASEWGLRSFFGRLNYNYNDKYLFEANARYDGSSRFPTGNKFGFFPSLSAGWRISEEGFLKDNIAWVHELKIRGSWGKLGNQNIGNYPYQQVLSLGINYPFGGATQVLNPGTAALTLPNPEIHWETTRGVDVGADLSVLNGKLSFSIDYFDKLTTGILYNTTVSAVLGLLPSVQNAGIVSNRGIDLNIQHHNSFGDFSYTVAANFSYTRNEVRALANVNQDIAKGLFVGKSLQSIYGYVTNGVFADQHDIDSSPTQPYNEKPGDIKFVDISGPNGVPDGKVNAQYDRKIIGNRFPKYNYGGNISVSYKSFDLSVQVEGVAGVNNIISGYEGNAFNLGSNPQQWMIDNRWSPANPNPNAKYPRLAILSGSEPQFAVSTYVMKNASFMRINNLQIGYTLPSGLTQRFKIDRFRLYVSARNLYNFDHYYTGWDPEINTNYPPVRTLVFGINLNF